MAIIVFDPTIVKASTVGGRFEEGVAGVALAVGDWVYKDASRIYQKADCTSATKAAVAGIAMNNAIAGGTVYVNETEDITTDAVLTKDVVYVISTTAARIMPYVDLGTGNLITIVGVAGSTTSLIVGTHATGIAKT